jgi:hypothetical protein
MMSKISDNNEAAPGETEGQCPVRRFPLRRPESHKAPIARYSAALKPSTRIAVLFLGVQSQDQFSISNALTALRACVQNAGDAPDYRDDAVFTDKSGYLNHVVALYWLDARVFHAWSNGQSIAHWLDEVLGRPGIGVWWEPIVVDAERMETITFKEFRRGFSGCPASALQPTEGSGYWGAARDRIPAAAYDLFEPTVERTDGPRAMVASRHHTVQPPANMAVIRSGVSWEKCEGDQLKDYVKRIKPKLDEGMIYLRDHPRETGCLTLRQVAAVGNSGQPLAEAYSLGIFLSLGHLESWAEHHPTHLSIYARAMAARKRYQDALQLRTYNEIFVLDHRNPAFEYFNCHPHTGLLPHACSLGKV